MTFFRKLLGVAAKSSGEHFWKYHKVAIANLLHLLSKPLHVLFRALPNRIGLKKRYTQLRHGYLGNTVLRIFSGVISWTLLNSSTLVAVSLMTVPMSSLISSGKLPSLLAVIWNNII